MTLFTVDISWRGQMRPRVQLYFHSGTYYIINGNFGLVKFEAHWS